MLERARPLTRAPQLRMQARLVTRLRTRAALILSSWRPTCSHSDTQYTSTLYYNASTSTIQVLHYTDLQLSGGRVEGGGEVLVRAALHQPQHHQPGPRSPQQRDLNTKNISELEKYLLT